MKDVFLIYFFVCFFSVVLGSSGYEHEDNSVDEENAIDGIDDNGHPDLNSKVPIETESSNCWLSLNAAEHIKILDDIDARYANVRERVQKSLKENDFNSAMIYGFKRSRDTLRHHGKWIIPSGLNLGGYCTLRMSESLLFFHRMNLRNNTYFRVEFLHNDLSNMIVRIELALNDLHLKGAFEQSLNFEHNPSVLIYTPTFGQVEFLLINVKYNIEGRYRLINNRLLIELVSSDIIVDDILMTYVNYNQVNNSAIRVEKKKMDNFIARMKRDLDNWIKDYFNEYLIYADMDGIPNMEELGKYDEEKGTALEDFTNNSIHAIATRIRLLKADNISLPSFTFETMHGLKIKLNQGVLYGLDSIYKRSVATGYKKKDIRLVDCIVGFSNMKVVYKYYLASLPTGAPPVAGALTLTANELTARLSLAMISDPETVDLNIEILDQIQPESLTFEGAANVIIANFKHQLEHQIVTTMSNTLEYSLLVIKSLPRCVPFVPGQTFKVVEETTQNNFSDWDSESEKMLRGKTEPWRPSTKYPKSLNK